MLKQVCGLQQLLLQSTAHAVLRSAAAMHRLNGALCCLAGLHPLLHAPRRRKK
jgi:hypothetical protein